MTTEARDEQMHTESLIARYSARIKDEITAIGRLTLAVARIEAGDESGEVRALLSKRVTQTREQTLAGLRAEIAERTAIALDAERQITALQS